jgi:uncharacterized cupin superfamily protein
MQNPKLPVHESAVPAETWYSGTDREIHGRALSDLGGASKIGVGLLELPPGCNTQPGHYHSHEEEHLYLLEGELTLHLGSQRHRLGPGSYVHFPAGQAVPHHLENDGTLPARYLMVGERNEEDRVTYP